MIELRPLLSDNISSNSYGFFLGARIPEWDTYKNDIVEFAVKTFKKDYNPTNGYNVLLDPNKLNIINTIYDDFLKICFHNFNNINVLPRNKKVMWAYVQNKERYNSVWHNHKNTTTINAVWYPSVPDESGTLAIRDGEGIGNIPVKEGWIYFWPYWMDHKPNPQKHSMDWRVSINIELISDTRPYFKPTNTLW